MGIPVYLWLTDDGGNAISGPVDIRQRESSIEVIELMHAIELPTDDVTGRITAKHQHCGYAFEKEVDCSTPYLYKAATTGQRLQKAEFKFYRISVNGLEEEYFRTTLEGVHVSSIEPCMLDCKNPRYLRHNHHEYIELTYEKITWHYLDGNIIHSDSWNNEN